MMTSRLTKRFTGRFTGSGGESTPAAYTPASKSGLRLWLVGDDTARQFSDDLGTVAIDPAVETGAGWWGNRMPEAFQGTQANSSNRPRVGPTILHNGRRVVRCDGLNDRLQFNHADLMALMNANNTLAFAGINRNPNKAGDQQYVSGVNSSPSSRFRVGIQAAGTTINMLSGTASTTVAYAADSNFHVYVLRNTGTVLELIDNGNVIATGVSATATLAQLAFGSQANTTGNPSQFDFAEICWWDSSLSDSELDDFGNYCVTEWGGFTWFNMTAPLLFTTVGDSIFNHGYKAAGNTWEFEGRGIIMNLSEFNDYRFYLPVTNVRAVPGRTASQVAANIASDLAGLTFDFCAMQMGRNSISDGVSATSICNSINSCINHVVDTLGKRVMVFTMIPGPHSVDAEIRKQRVDDVNAWIMAQDGTRDGKVIAVDIHTILDDGNGEIISDACFSPSDTVHLNNYGGRLGGDGGYQKLGPMFGKGRLPDFAGPDNLLLNGILAGAAGTITGGVSGVAPDSWTFRGFNGATAGRVGSKNGDGSFRATQLIDSASSELWRLSQAVSGGISIGDKIYGAALVQITDGPIGMSTFFTSLTLNGSGLSNPTIARNYSQPPAEIFYDGMPYYLFRTPAIPVVSGTGLGFTYLIEAGKGSADPSSNFIVDIKGIGVFKAPY
jgi:hypothetical protein